MMKLWYKIKNWLFPDSVEEAIGMEMENTEPSVVDETFDERVDDAVEEIMEDLKEEVELPDFNSMTKLEIDVWARSELGLKLDRRHKKTTMIQKIKDHVAN